MYPVRFGGNGVPTNLDYATRYNDDGGTVTDGAPNDMPLVARPTLVLGDVLTTSVTAKGPYDAEEYRRLHIEGWNEAIGMALTGRRDNADNTRLVGVRLAAAGYVNPHDIIAGAHRPDIALLTTDVVPMP